MAGYSGRPPAATQGIREVGPAAGLVDNKACAVDEVWSRLRSVVRLANRKGLVT